jgi:hypothetical protein
MTVYMQVSCRKIAGAIENSEFLLDLVSLMDMYLLRSVISRDCFITDFWAVL